ncbi:MAG: hypothetical protein NZ919_03615 [Candidatus Caldarchaeum sp.]|nr:hypothetical protein [Candidatus Caldarchaeum sp.]
MRVVQEAEDFIVFEVEGQDQSLLGMLTEKINTLEGVQYAGYRLEHPLTGIVSVSVKVDPTKTTPRNAVMKALKDLNELVEKLESKVMELR